MMRILFVALLAIVTMVAIVEADIVWEDNMDDVSDWSIVWDPSTTASLGAGGSTGLMSVGAAGATAAFAHNDRVPFDVAQSASYEISADLAAVDYSMSYNLVIDQFDSGNTYLGSTWVMAGSTYAGTTNIPLGGYSFDATTASIAPKFGVSTGDGLQIFAVDNIALSSSIPEPTSAALLVLGLCTGFMRFRVNRKRR